MTTNTETTAATLAVRADAAIAAFLKDNPTEYVSMSDQIADLIAGLHLVARNGGIDWKTVVENGATIYKVLRSAAKPAENTAAKPTSGHAQAPGALWALTATLPTGQAVSVQRSKPYGFAAAIQVGGEWAVYAWVSSKETATKRIGDAKRGGIEVTAHAVIETTVAQLAEAQVEGEGEGEGEPAEPQPAAVELETTPLPFDIEAEGEIERVAEDAEPIVVKIVGGTAAHYSDDGDTTFCGIEGRDLRQDQGPVSCRSCIKVAAARQAKA